MLGRVAGVASWRLGVLLVVMALAAALRSWGLLSGELVWHPDEIFMVVFPMNMLSGDLNPHVFTYPGFHFYLLAAIYGAKYLLYAAAGGESGLSEWVAGHYLWAPEAARATARWLSVFYSVATVAATGMLGGRLAEVRAMRRWQAITSTAGLLAASLAAVNVLLVRQAPLAGNDTPLAFWFVIATLASLRLLRVGALRDYVLAGALVGVCAAIKYPGASAAGGVVAVHLLAGRAFADRRVWAAGLVSIVTFLLLSPYTLLDVGTFRDHFLFQLQHAEEGRWNLHLGPFYQLTETLRHGAGLLAWLGWLIACGWVIWKRPAPHLVVLGATFAAYMAVSWGELVFARYVLSLVPLQLALVAESIVRSCRYLAGVGRLSHRFVVPAAVTIALILAIQPAYGAWHVARLQGTRDTRSEARAWIESNVPPGSTLCNFGGWAGDPQVNTFEDLWWRFKKFTGAYGEQDFMALRLADHRRPDASYYSYAVQTSNEDQAEGSISLIHRRECNHVILHEHPLPYSRIDTLLRRRLENEARPVVTFDPGRVQASTFDLMDAYYIPLAGWDLAAAGPRIEVWEIPQYRSRSTARNATTVLMEVMAAIARDAGNLTAAAVAYEAILELVPEESRALQGLAQLSVQQGDYERAIEQYNRARRERPRDASLLNNLAVSHRAVGHADTARTLWREALSLQDDHADAHYNLGTALYLDGESAQALPHLRRAVELAPDSAKYHSNAAAAHQAVGLPLQAVAFWQSAIRVDPSYVDAYFNMAFTFQYDLGDPESALRHWEMARELTPADADVIMHGAQALLDLGHMDAAASWLRTFLDRNPQHLRNRELEAALEKIRVAPG